MFITYSLVHAQRDFTVNNKGKLIETHNIITTATSDPSNPVHGDVWFDTTTNITRIWDGTNWKGIVGNTIGDLKYGVETTDHEGWVILDGRAIATLPTTQQTQATALRFLGNIPDARDRTLMMRNTGAIGDLGGDTTVPILQGNLPNLTLVATITNTGDHTHTYTDMNPNTIRQHGIRDNIVLISETSTVRTTSTNGNHLHTVNIASGGSNTPIAINPQFLQTNVFIFLGD